MRMYHVIVINERTGRKVYMTRTPVTHAEGCTMLSKIDARKHCRKQLEERDPKRAPFCLECGLSRGAHADTAIDHAPVMEGTDALHDATRRPPIPDVDPNEKD